MISQKSFIPWKIFAVFELMMAPFILMLEQCYCHIQ
jgi:hypothetical protein